MRRRIVVASVITLFGAPYTGAEPATPPQWQDIAACAAGYRANYENRMSVRPPSMSNGIELQADDYKKAAVRHHQKTMQTSLEDSQRTIDVYIAANVARFIAMDKDGALEPFLDACPEIEVD